uniref:Uncharacterized protein n=1 Tax=Anser brachyrhynchus TaxID=132585 RepID=A0A8B9C633_9AVES
VLPIQPVCFITRDEELGAVGTFTARSGRAGLTRPRVLENEVFIIKLLPVDGFASSAVVVGEVSSLAHELGDDAVEAAPLEAEAFLVGTEAAEIFCSGPEAEVSTAPQPLHPSSRPAPHLRSWAPRQSAGGSGVARRVCSRS